jgi:hypothetical protein
MKEYIVVAHNEAAIDSLHEDLTTETNKRHVPDRPVDVADPRELSPRVTHYYLTDDEAARLKRDHRVNSVDMKPPTDTIRHHAMLNLTELPTAYNGTVGNFNRNANSDVYNVNWGLRRTELTAAERTIASNSTYVYDEDASGVDIVIMDDGVQANHPEFLSNGVSRVQEIDWYAAAGVSGTMPTGFYDYSIYGEAEHGTHVAGIAAGKIYGYAKNARIYSMRVFDNTPFGTKSFTNNPGIGFDLIRLWHNKKFQVGGSRRPTIVNMSWGYVTYYSGNGSSPSAKNITSITYRGNTANYPKGTGYQISNGQVGSLHGFRVPSIDSQIKDGEAAGIIYIGAAGNYSHKVDVLGGPDWNNSYKLKVSYIAPAGTAIKYHQGGSPKGTITVSAADYATVASGSILKEQLATYSERGPGCDVISPGSYISSSTSLNTSFTSFNYVFGTQPQTSNKSCKISGTSMAAPQVTGICALRLARYPTTTPAQMKTWLVGKSIKNVVQTSTPTNDWTNLRALLGGPNNYAFMPYKNGFTD